MINMSDKFVFIYYNDDNEMIDAGIIAGCSYDEIEAKAKMLEKTQGGHYTFSKDQILAEVVYHFNHKRDEHYMAEVDEWEDIQNTVENIEDYVRDASRTISNYIEELKKKSIDN